LALGEVLSTKDGGQIFGFDIDQSGNDGVLASAEIYGSTALVSVETFNQNSGKITSSFAIHDGTRKEYGVDGILPVTSRSLRIISAARDQSGQSGATAS